ncbi:MAG: 50S ribosomal protein L29 [Treponema sp.]|jgi:large subunit ribosomal protein L29|nr:50S ribosomal protein L29 [Treponema sp.]
MKNSFKNLSFPEQKAKRDELTRKYMDLRFQMVIGHVDNPLQKRIMRRQIARLNTLVHLHEIEDAKQALRQKLAAGGPAPGKE